MLSQVHEEHHNKPNERCTKEEETFLTIQRGHHSLPQCKYQPQRGAEQEEVSHLEVKFSQGASFQHGAVAGAPRSGLPMEHTGVETAQRENIHTSAFMSLMKAMTKNKECKVLFNDSMRSAEIHTVTPD